jgi:hypothetical protein
MDFFYRGLSIVWREFFDGAEKSPVKMSLARFELHRQAMMHTHREGGFSAAK